MLETIRKHHYILMLFVAIVVCVAFVFFGDHGKPGHEGDTKAIATLGGEDYYRADLEQIQSQYHVVGSLLDPSNQLAQITDPLAFYTNTLGGSPRMRRPAIAQRYGASSRDSLNLDFCLNVATLRAEAAKLGIAVDREDLEKFVQTVAGFQTNGQFDSTKYESYLNSGAFGDRPNTEKRLYTTLRDVMLFQRLNKLIGGTYAPSAAEVDARYAESKQKTTAAFALVEKSKQTAEPLADDAVQKFHDAQAERFKAHAEDPAKSPADPLILSDELRSIRYVLVTMPEPPAALTTPQPADTTGLSEEAKKAKEEEYKKQIEEHTAAMAARATAMETFEATKKELLTKADKISQDLSSEDRGSTTFDEIVKASGLEPLLSPDFTAATAPDDLKADPKLVSEIFAAPNDLTIPHTNKIEKGYALFELAKVTPPAVLPLDDVKTKITERLQADALTAAVKAAADKARTAILDSIKEGKTFAEAATAAGLTPVEVPAFTKDKAPTVPNASVISEAAAELNPGEVSTPKEVPEGLALITTLKRELPTDPKMAEDKASMAKEMTEGGEGGFIPTYSPLFEAWFNARRNELTEVAPQA